MAARRRRVKEVRDDIEVFSLNSQKTRKIPRRDFEATPKIEKDVEGNFSSQNDREVIIDITEGLVEKTLGAGHVCAKKSF